MLSIAEVQGLILDVDDVVLDNGNQPGDYVRNIHSRSRLAAVHEVGERHELASLVDITPEQNVQAFLDSPVHTLEGGLWQILLAAGLVAGDIDLAHPLLQEIAVSKEDKYFELLVTEGKPVHRVTEFVLAAANYGLGNFMAIASNARRRTIDIALAKAGIARLFPDERIISLERVSRPKPDGETFEQAFQTLGLPDGARPFVLAVEDDPRGVQSAKATRLFTSTISTRYHQETLRALPIPPDYAAKDYDELAAMLGLPMPVA